MIDRLVDRIGRGVAWLNVGMVGATCVVVVLRYAFDAGAIFRRLRRIVLYHRLTHAPTSRRRGRAGRFGQ